MTVRPPTRRLSCLWLAVAAAACDPASPPVAGEPGSPLPDISARDSAQFLIGQALFNRAFTAEEGLGPLFNERQCSGCHDIPTSGGSGAEIVQKATRFDPATNTCDLLHDEGGDNIQQRATAGLTQLGFSREPRPPSATAFETVIATSLYGLGLIEAIPEATLLGLADPDDRNGDGISGRVGRTADGRLARFGRKATDATIAEFVDGAVRAELGLTTPGHPTEESLGPNAMPDGADPAADPELTEAQLQALVDYVRLLAPPARLAGPEDVSVPGEALFDAVGCIACHVPALSTGPSDDPAFDRRTVALYSDLLLHDLGSAMAGICGHTAIPSEYRTAPLMGLRFRIDLLHDGRAQSIERAILSHGGEATGARGAYLSLSEDERQSLLSFLQRL